jgi:L-alanine-DL-glutamate epimerase-like enolase superfamily enzyme
VIKVGGITEFLKVADMGMKLAPHSPYFGPGALATIHLIAARAPEARFEIFYLWADAKPYPGVLEKNSVSVPESPGLGFEPDAGVIAKYRAG